MELDAYPSHAEIVTPDDSKELRLTGLYIGGDGDLSVILASDSTAVTFTGIPAGTMFPFRVYKVMAATTATGIVGVS